MLVEAVVELRVSYRERLLGIYVGIDAGIKDQYRYASEKFERTMAVFNAARSKLSIVARIVATNIFLNTLFAYQNRLFFMPAALLREFEQQFLRFITPTPWLKLGFLSAIKDLYGISCELVDLRSANVASVLATYERCTAMREGLAASLSRWRRGWRRLVHPALSWCAAFDYFKQATGRTHADTLHGASMRRTDINEYRVLLKALRSADVPNWAGYLDARVRAKGWDHTSLRQGLRRVPRSLPQGHRWFLLKIHLNAPMTSARIASAGGGQIQPCLFCRAPGGDRWDHLACRGCVMSACDRLFHAGHIPALTTAYPTLMMQTNLDGATLAAVVATFAAVWRVRAACRNTSAIISHDYSLRLACEVIGMPMASRLLTNHGQEIATRLAGPGAPQCARQSAVQVRWSEPRPGTGRRRGGRLGCGSMGNDRGRQRRGSPASNGACTHGNWSDEQHCRIHRSGCLFHKGPSQVGSAGGVLRGLDARGAPDGAVRRVGVQKPRPGEATQRVQKTRSRIGRRSRNLGSTASVPRVQPMRGRIGESGR